MTTFEKIKEIAKDRGISLKKLGPKSGLSENTIYSWQQKSPGIKSLEKVARALNVPVSKIIEEPKKTNVDSKKSIDLDDEELLMSFDGKPIPDEDRELIITMLRQLRNGREHKNN